MKPDSISYYPHIEFQNVAWVKSSLLLWNHVYRIVPFIDFEAEAPDSTLRRLSEFVGPGQYILLDLWALHRGPYTILWFYENTFKQLAKAKASASSAFHANSTAHIGSEVTTG